LTYHSEPYGDKQIGVYAGTTAIPVVDSPSEKFRQIVIGSFAEWDLATVLMTAELQYVHTTVDLSVGAGASSMLQGYLQLDHALTSAWDVYGRIELTSESSSGTSYLSLIPAFAKNSVLGGVRFQFGRQQALKLEIAQRHTVEDSFSTVMLEWSAAFP
jgi:hypothetical protein